MIADLKKVKIDENTNPNSGIGVDTAASKSMTLMGKKNKLPAYMQSLNQAEKAENFKIIDSMNKKISY